MEPWEPPPELEPWLDTAWLREAPRTLLLPVVELPVAEVAWTLDLPWWEDEDGTAYRIRPLDVVGGPHRERVDAADLAAPVDVTWRHERWLVLDGIERVLKAARTGRTTLPARIVPPEILEGVAA